MGTNQYSSCRDFLESYGELRAEEARLAELCRSLWEQATKITAQYSVAPGGGSGGGNDGMLTAMTNARVKAEAKYIETLRREEELSEFLDSVEGSTNRIILRMRYLELRTWPEVADRMRRLGSRYDYDERHIYRLHGQALDAARKRWSELERSESR